MNGCFRFLSFLVIHLLGINVCLAQDRFSAEDFVGVYSSETDRRSNPTQYFEVYMMVYASQTNMERRIKGTNVASRTSGVVRRVRPSTTVPQEFETVSVLTYRVVIKTVIYHDKGLKNPKTEQFFVGETSSNALSHIANEYDGKIPLLNIRRILKDMSFAKVLNSPEGKSTISIPLDGRFSGVLVPGLSTNSSGIFKKAKDVPSKKWESFVDESNKLTHEIMIHRHTVERYGKNLLYIGREAVTQHGKTKYIQFFVDLEELNNLDGKNELKVLAAEDKTDWKLDPHHYSVVLPKLTRYIGVDDAKSNQDAFPPNQYIIHHLVHLYPSIENISVFVVSDWDLPDLYTKNAYEGKFVVVSRSDDHSVPWVGGFRMELKSLWD